MELKIKKHLSRATENIFQNTQTPAPHQTRSARLNLATSLHHRVNVARDLHLRKNPRDFSVGRDHESAALDPHELSAVEGFFFPDAVGFADLSVLVGEERKREGVLGLEFLMARHWVLAYAEDDGLGLFQSAERVLKVTGLLGASGREILGVEVEDHRLSFEIFQADFFARVRNE
jgi:hypothetical protein